MQSHPGAFALALALAVAGATTAGCRRAARSAGGRTTITVAGSTSVQPFAEKWAEAYHAEHPGLEIQVQGGGSTAGVQATLSGAADLGTCSRDLKPDEAAKLHATVIAIDGEAVIVHPDNPLAGLTLEQVRGIYAATTRNWKEVGGRDAGITVVTREMGSGARGAFEDLAMKKTPIAASALVQDSQGAVRQMVSADANAIGFISYGVVDDSVKALMLDGIAPGPDSIRGGSYPLVRPFLFLTRVEPAGAVKDFIDWVRGPEAQAIAQADGLFPPP
jgi:phosphate transport system substrate-binding protein